jgi:hypothetical protein
LTIRSLVMMQKPIIGQKMKLFFNARFPFTSLIFQYHNPG